MSHVFLAIDLVMWTHFFIVAYNRVPSIIDLLQILLSGLEVRDKIVIPHAHHVIIVSHFIFRILFMMSDVIFILIFSSSLELSASWIHLVRQGSNW